MRGPDGEHIVTLERVWGHEPRTVMEPTTLLAVIARKPRMWGESPIRVDFPANVRDLLDRMDARARADLLDDIRYASATNGFAAAAKAVSAIIDAGRRIDRASTVPDRQKDPAGRRRRLRPRPEPIQHLHGGTMTTDPKKRTDRTTRKATAEQVMELSRNLPLTRSVPGRAVENATPGQLGFLSDLFRAENASRAEPRTGPSARTGRVPPIQGTRRLRPGAWPRSPPTGDANSSRPSSSSTTPRTSCSTDDAGMRAGPRLAIAIGTLACQQGIPVRFFTASGLIMRLRKAKTDNRLDQELKTIGKADLLIIERARLPAHRHRRRQAPVPGSSPTATVRRSIILRLEPGSGRWGDVFGRPRSWPPPSSTASTRHGRIIRFHGESYRNTHSLMK